MGLVSLNLSAHAALLPLRFENKSNSNNALNWIFIGGIGAIEPSRTTRIITRLAQFVFSRYQQRFQQLQSPACFHYTPTSPHPPLTPLQWGNKSQTALPPKSIEFHNHRCWHLKCGVTLSDSEISSMRHIWSHPPYTFTAPLT